MSKLSIIIPVYNEQMQLAQVKKPRVKKADKEVELETYAVLQGYNT